MEIDPGLRRVLPPGPLPEADPVLEARIRDEIAAGGPMTFARFMELALYDPERGYYRGEEARPGRAGDFLTAPETHPVFGMALARTLDEMWSALGRPDRFTLREYGAGSGSLVLAVLEGLRAARSGLVATIRYEPVELSAERRAEVARRLEAAGLGAVLEGAPGGRPTEAPVDGSAGPAAPGLVGCVLANEFLDALPVHRVAVQDGRLVELYVGWEAGNPDPDRPASPAGRFVDVAGPPSTSALAERLARVGAVLAEGQRGEVCLSLDEWVAEVGRSLARGFVLVVDYGHPAPVLYAVERRGGTLRTYVRHTVGSDPYARVGRQDLTAHVDFTALEQAADRNGLAVLGTTTQAEFLVGSGIGDLLIAAQADPTTGLGEYLELRASLARLLDPAAMGGFGVVVLGRGVPADTHLAGLAFRLTRPTPAGGPVPGHE